MQPIHWLAAIAEFWFTLWPLLFIYHKIIRSSTVHIEIPTVANFDKQLGSAYAQHINHPFALKRGGVDFLPIATSSKTKNLRNSQ